MKRLFGASRKDQGGAMVEFALCLPIMMLMITGIYSVGNLLQQDMQLTDSVNVGAMDIAINGSSLGSTGDPCSRVSTDITNSSPFLNSANMSFSYVFNGTSYSGTSCSGVSLTSGNTMQVTATYPCSITIYLAPVLPGCTISASLSEIIQ
jgi:Flp pilus assembly protein TadG